MAEEEEITYPTFAKVEDGIVTNVIVAEQAFVDAQEGTWIKDSLAGEISDCIRKNRASKGYTYDEERDAFIPPKPFDSWTLNEDTCVYDSPVEYPDDGNRYSWNEDTTSWDEVDMEAQ